MSFNSLFGLGGNPAGNCVGFWPMQDNAATTTVNDESTLNRDGTASANTSTMTVAGPNNWLSAALNFNGTSHEISFGDILNVNPTSDQFSIYAWLKPAAVDEAGYLFNRTDSAAPADGWSWYLRGTSDDLIAAAGQQVTTNSVASTANITESGSWLGAGFSVNAQAVVHYKNGLANGSGTIPTPNSDATSGTCYFGNRIGGSSAGTRYAGAVAGLCIFDVVLDAAAFAEIDAGPEPVNSTRPTLSMGATAWSGTVGTWGLPAPFASGSNGTISYAWELRLRSDDSVVESGTGSSPSGTGTYNDSYYLWVRATNSGGYDQDATSPIPVTLVDRDFASDVGSWTAGTAPVHSTDEGWAWVSGVANFYADTTGSIPYIDFTAQSDSIRLEFDIKCSFGGSIVNGDEFWIFLMPPATAVAAANSCATVTFEYLSATSTEYTQMNYQNNSGKVQISQGEFIRDQWYRIRIDLDISSRTFNIYLDDRLFQYGIISANASYTQCGRVAFYTEGDMDVQLDNLRVIGDFDVRPTYTIIEDDFTVGSGDVGGSLPDTDNRNVYPQTWRSPDDLSGTNGILTRSGSGLTAESGKHCSAQIRASQDGYVEGTFALASADANRYAAVICRSYDGPNSASGGQDSIIYLRYNGTSANRLALFCGETIIASNTTVRSGTIKLGIRMDGYYIFAYVDDVLQFGGPVRLSATGNPGLMNEEICGPYILTIGGPDTTNYCTDFSVTSWIDPDDSLLTLDKTVGNIRLRVDGAIRELYQTDATGENETNLLWQRGIQFMHFNNADCNYIGLQRQVQWNTTNCLAFRQRNNNMREDQQEGYSWAKVAFTRRGIWAQEAYLHKGSWFITPDFDIKPDKWSRDIKYIGDGAVQDQNVPYQFWTAYVQDAVSVGFQVITDHASGNQLRMTHAFASTTNTAGATPWDFVVKNEGTGDAISLTGTIPDDKLAEGDYNVINRVILMETGALSLDSTTLSDWQSDLKSPATLASFSGGSIKTDAFGDDNNDGFNEGYGWYEITYSSGDLSFSNDSVKRVKPQFRVHGLTAAEIGSVTVASVSQTYYADDLGDGSVLIQLDADVAASAAIGVIKTSGTSAAVYTNHLNRLRV